MSEPDAPPAVEPSAAFLEEIQTMGLRTPGRPGAHAASGHGSRALPAPPAPAPPAGARPDLRARVRNALGELDTALRRTLREPCLAADVRRDRELAAGLRSTSTGCRRVLVLSAGPGSGQSTVAALLALSLARVRADRVAALDLDPLTEVLAQRLGAPDATTTDEVLAASTQTRWRGVAPARGGVVVVRSQTGAHDATRLERALVAVERSVAVTVVDPGPAPAALAGLLQGATGLVVAAPAGSTAAVGRVLGLVQDLGHGVLAAHAVAALRGPAPGGALPERSVVLPDDPALTGELDLSRTSPATRRAATRLALQAVRPR